MTPKNKVEVRICGKDYTIVGSECEEYIQKVCRYIDKKMNEIIRANSKLSTAMAAVLTSVNVADDFIKSVQALEEAKKEISTLTQEVEYLRKYKQGSEEANAALISEIEVQKLTNTELQLELAKYQPRPADIINVSERRVRQI